MGNLCLLATKTVTLTKLYEKPTNHYRDIVPVL